MVSGNDEWWWIWLYGTTIQNTWKANFFTTSLVCFDRWLIYCLFLSLSLSNINYASFLPSCPWLEMGSIFWFLSVKESILIGWIRVAAGSALGIRLHQLTCSLLPFSFSFYFHFFNYCFFLYYYYFLVLIYFLWLAPVISFPFY